MGKGFFKRTLAVFTAVLICITFIPCIAFGKTGQETENTVNTVEPYSGELNQDAKASEGDSLQEIPTEENQESENPSEDNPEQENPGEENPQPAIPSGWNETGTKYYDSTLGDYVKGAYSIGGVLYFFDNSGNLYRKKGRFSYGGRKYYGNGNGTLKVGYFKIGKYYYGYSPVYGNMLKGAATIYNKPYYFDSKGHGKSKGWIGKNYYCKGNGKLKTGYCRLKQGKKRYYFFFNKETGAVAKGYVYSGRPYWFNSKGHGKGKGWITYGSNRYYCKGNGILAVGYNKIGKYGYGFNTVNDSTGCSAGAMLRNGMFTIGSGKYWFNSNGKGRSAGWINLEDGRYYCRGDGIMAKGYVRIGSAGYWFGNRDGAAAFTFTPEGEGEFEVKYGGQVYKFGSDFKGVKEGWQDQKTRYCIGAGVMATGWTAIDNKVYFFNKKNAAKVCGRYVTGNNISKSRSGYAGIYIDEKGCIDGVKGEAYARAIKVLNKKGWNLRSAFNYSAKIKYYGRYKFTRSTGIAYNANYGFRTGKGNCYVMADTFYCMAKLMGYNIRAIGGTVGPTHPHSWTIIKQKGKWKVYDPNFTNETPYSGWNIYYGKKRTWRYAHTSNYMDMF